MPFNYRQQYLNSRNSTVPASIVADYSGNNTAGLSNGTDVSYNVAVGEKPKRAVTKVRILIDNRIDTGAGTGLSAQTVKASVEYPLSTMTPVFFGGQRTAVVQPGAILLSDPLTISIPADTLCWARVYGTVAAAGKWPLGTYAVGTLTPTRSHRYEAGAAVGDKADSGTIPAAVFGYSACASIMAADESIGDAVIGIGDSIINGATGGNFDGYFTSSFLYQACYRDGLPFMSQAVSGSDASASASARLLAAQGATIGYCNWGTNDIHSGTSLATVQANLIARWTEMKALGLRVFYNTIVPRTTSTDAWATTVNQTLNANSAARILLNNWVRDGAPTLAGVAVAAGSSAGGTVRAGEPGHLLDGWFEVADVVESARDSGLWKASATTDGVHPSAAMHALIAAVVIFPSVIPSTATTSFSALSLQGGTMLETTTVTPDNTAYVAATTAGQSPVLQSSTGEPFEVVIASSLPSVNTRGRKIGEADNWTCDLSGKVGPSAIVYVKSAIAQPNTISVLR